VKLLPWLKEREEARRAIEREREARKDVEAVALESVAKQTIIEEISYQLTRHLRANHFGDLVADSMKRRDA